MDFRKSLITTSAICAASMLAATVAEAAEKPKLRIYGYIETFMGLSDQDKSGAASTGTPTYTGANDEFGIVQYGEIRFAVEGMTDSGMKWGAYFEDVQNDRDITGKKNSTDEVNLWLSGSWGKVEIGGQDGAADKMSVYGRKIAYTARDMPGIWGDVNGNHVRGTDLTSIVEGSDDTKITYYTPRFNGFQAGYSWAPHTGTRGTVLTDEGPNHELSAGWKGGLGGGSLNAAASYTRLDAADTVDGGDLEAWTVGAIYEFGPYSVGASYLDNGNRRSGAEQTAWDASVGYDGGKWGVALTYYEGHADPAAAGVDDEEFKMWQLSGGYNLGGGLSMSAGLYFWDLEANTDDEDNDGITGVVGINARF